MIAAIATDDLLIGLALGFAFGLLAGPLIRSWLGWREAMRVAREADLLEHVLTRMEAPERSALETPQAPAGSPSRTPAASAPDRSGERSSGVHEGPPSPHPVAP